MVESFYTTEQVANILQVHPFTILKYIKEGRLRGLKLGRVYRIMESDVQEFIEDRIGDSSKKQQEITEKDPMPKPVNSTSGNDEVPLKAEEAEEEEKYFKL